MAERLPDGARGVEDPQCGHPNRNYSPRDDSPSGPQPYKRDRARDGPGVPSPQQQAEGNDHVVASLSLGPPSVPLIFLGQEPAAAQANTTQPRLDPGFNQDSKPVSSHADAFSSLNLGASPILHETQRKLQAYIQAANHQPTVIGPSRDNEAQVDLP